MIIVSRILIDTFLARRDIMLFDSGLLLHFLFQFYLNSHSIAKTLFLPLEMALSMMLQWM